MSEDCLKERGMVIERVGWRDEEREIEGQRQKESEGEQERFWRRF